MLEITVPLVDDPLECEGKPFLVALLSIRFRVHLSSFPVTKRFLHLQKHVSKIVLVLMLLRIIVKEKNNHKKYGYEFD
jgi:hypothetical protein